MEASLKVRLSALAAVLDLERCSDAGIGRENPAVEAIGANFGFGL
jgi:hypothetical protein